MEYEKIKQLIEDVGNSKLTSIDIDFPDGTKISMKKEIKQEIIVANKEANEPVINMPIAEKKEIEEDGPIVKSPMVGKSSPTSEPYVEVGKDVKKGDTLCIIEAMKLMNEIEAEFSGKVIEILVKDGQSVEYGTPLFKIR